MASYKLGNWTATTIDCLTHVDELRKQNKKIQPADIESGTLRNWAYALIKGGYLSDTDGLELTGKGKELLEELKRNPPRRKRRTKKIDVVTKSYSSEGEYKVTVQGSDTFFEKLVSRIDATRIITQLAKKKAR